MVSSPSEIAKAAGKLNIGILNVSESVIKCSRTAVQAWTAAASSSYSLDVKHFCEVSQAAFEQLLSWHSYHHHY